MIGSEQWRNFEVKFDRQFLKKSKKVVSNFENLSAND